MHPTLVLLALAGASDAIPCPSSIAKRFSSVFSLKKRQTIKDFNDGAILNYALTLEHLEATFYRQGLLNFTQADFLTAGFDTTFYQNLVEISADEKTHVDFLTGALKAAGVTPVQECTYSFPVTSVSDFLAVANILEGVGTSAYLGAAASIANKAYLTAAGSVLTVEARHSSYLRASLAQSPFPSPQDVPLTPNEVYTLASGFIASCPSGNPTLPVRAFPGLTLTTTGAIKPGQQISISTNSYALAPKKASAHLYAAFVTAGGPVWADLVVPGNGVSPFQVTVPQGVLGQSYLLFCNCNTTVTDDSTIAGPLVVEISKAVAS